MRAKTALTLAAVFTLGLAAGTLLSYKALRETEGRALEAMGHADKAVDLTEDAVDLMHKWQDQAMKLDASLQRCVEQKAHRSQAN